LRNLNTFLGPLPPPVRPLPRLLTEGNDTKSKVALQPRLLRPGMSLTFDF